MTMDLDAEFNAARVRLHRSIGQRVRHAKACIRALVASKLRLLELRWVIHDRQRVIHDRQRVRYVMPDTLDQRTARMLVDNGWPR